MFSQGGPVGAVHPDISFGHMQQNYSGPSWTAAARQMPSELFLAQSFATMTNYQDLAGLMIDPEDPRHPLMLMQEGVQSMWDGTFHMFSVGDYGQPSRGSRLYQALYDAYLEPFSNNRVCATLSDYYKAPNNMFGSVFSSAEYVAGTASLIGQVVVGMGSVIMEGVTVKADTNCVYIGEGCQILENTMIMSDAPSNLLAYQRQENLNPYQQWDGLDGVCSIKQNTIVEQNCYLDACHIGPFNRIGHGTKIMKGVTTGTMVHILPGSIVLPETKIGDGELYGGAPAIKLGKVSKYEWKRPYFASLLHREAVVDQYRFQTDEGMQLVEHADAMNKLNCLMIQYESDVTPQTKEKIRMFVEGREPYNHTIVRMFQSWSPNVDLHHNPNQQPPLPSMRVWAEHNKDSDPLASNGSYVNFREFSTDFRW